MLLDVLDVREQIDRFLSTRLAFGDVQVACLDYPSWLDYQNKRRYKVLLALAVAGSPRRHRSALTVEGCVFGGDEKRFVRVVPGIDDAASHGRPGRGRSRAAGVVQDR